MTEDKDETAERARAMHRLFEGYHKAYGTYDADDTIPSELKGGKIEIKQSAATVRRFVTDELWADHLSGMHPLGIIPIRENNTCLWGVIDIDSYDVSHLALVETCARHKFPLVVCRSKSGGAHLFLFLAEALPAEIVQAKLREMAAAIGHGAAEIFPKQRQVALDRGDLGSWLNMPYFGGDETDRYAFSDKGLQMSLDGFIARAESLQQPREFMLQELSRPEGSAGKKNPDFGDGPPCLAHMAKEGIPVGMRNKGMFNMATFAKKKYGQGWVDQFERWNHELLDEPLGSAEMQEIVKQQEKKEYHYQCRDHPLLAHCNSSTCRMRRFGVAGEEAFPVISGLSVLKTQPPLYFLDVNNERLELTTDELISYKLFHKVCFERIHVCFQMMKQTSWTEALTLAMKDLTFIEVSHEVSQAGQFEELLEEFLVNRHRGVDKEDLLVGRPWEDTEDPENARHYFRLKDLEKFLEGAGFRVLSRAHIVTRIRSIGGSSAFFNLKGKGVNVWWVPSRYLSTPTPSNRSVPREPI